MSRDANGSNGNQPDKPRPERTESLGVRGCGACGATGWALAGNRGAYSYVEPCRCRRDYLAAIGRVRDYARQGLIDYRRRETDPPPGDRELSLEQCAGLLDEARYLLKRNQQEDE